ncbi:CynX/NimT family MFS transporter [Chloroflexota bacterium]
MGTGNTASDIKASRRWAIFGVLYLCNLAYAITLQSVPPVLSLVMADLGLSYTQGGLLMSLLSLPGIVISIPAGMLADRYGQKLIGVSALTLILAGAMIFALGNSLPILGLGRVISGIGGITLAVLAPQLLAQWFERREIGIAMGMFVTAMPVGTILSLNLLSLVGESLGWRTSIYFSAGIPLIALVIFAFFFANAPRRRQQILPRPQGLLRDIRLAGMTVWFVGVAWMMFNASAISLFTFTPDFLKATGFSIASAGFLTSLVMMPGLVFSPVVGYMIHKIGHKQVIIAIGGLTVAALVVLVPSFMGQIKVLMPLIGIAQTLVPAPIFALVPEVVSPKRLGLGYGIVSTCLHLGILVGPTSVGFMRDIVGSYQASYTLMSGFALLTTLAVVILSILNRMQK